MLNKYKAGFYCSPQLVYTVSTEMYLRRYTYIIGDTQVNDSVMTDVMKQIAKKKKVDKYVSINWSVSYIITFTDLNNYTGWSKPISHEQHLTHHTAKILKPDMFKLTGLTFELLLDRNRIWGHLPLAGHLIVLCSAFLRFLLHAMTFQLLGLAKWGCGICSHMFRSSGALMIIKNLF